MFSNTSYSLATVDISVGPDLPTTFPDFLLDAGQLSPPAVATHGSWELGLRGSLSQGFRYLPQINTTPQECCENIQVLRYSVNWRRLAPPHWVSYNY